MKPTAPTAEHEKPIANHELPLHEHEANDGTNLGGWQRAWNSFERQLVAYNFEARGIERVEPDERQDLRLLGYSQVAIMWFSVNLAANNITLGMLGPAVFSLGFVDACLRLRGLSSCRVHRNVWAEERQQDHDLLEVCSTLEADGQF
jgi:hypothetical protein